MTTQRCPRCTATLPLDAFPKRYQGKPGNYCTECSRKYSRDYSRAHYTPTPPRTCTECDTRVYGARTQCAGHTPRPTPPPRALSTTYQAVHRRIVKAKGKASTHQCPCGKAAEHWAYNHSGNDETGQQWNGKHVRYSTDTDQYDALCRSCHVKRDGNGYATSKLRALNESRKPDPSPSPTRWWEVDLLAG